MARYAAQGARVVCVVATRGELGRIVTPDLATPENLERLGEIREEELRRALAILGPIECRLLDYRDSGTADAPGSMDARAFARADVDEAAGRLVRIIREVEADVIIAPNAYGTDGHPDHIQASRIARLAYDRAGDRDAYPEQLDGTGLAPWSPSKLYEPVLEYRRRRKLARAVRSGDLRALVSMAVRFAGRWDPAREGERRRAAAAQGPITTRIDVADYLEAKDAAIRAHRTQIAPDDAQLTLTVEERRTVTPTEDFSLRASRVEVANPEDDLFDGISAED
jgi:mycothiol S-conjugate amidase